MEDQRQFERFEIILPARLETVVLNKKHFYEVKTKNISASGAFIDTKSQFSEGTRIKISLSTQSKKIHEITGSQSLIECEGVVIRSVPQGAAICFDKDCQITSLKYY